ncbi:hypothetical protein [Clostridium sp. BJN0001]|nr:hypothetical protein [Clostridium sp. BJN0001]
MIINKILDIVIPNVQDDMANGLNLREALEKELIKIGYIDKKKNEE